MKYNPQVNEDVARLPGLCQAHPYLPDALAQGALELHVGAGAVPGARSAAWTACSLHPRPARTAS